MHLVYEPSNQMSSLSIVALNVETQCYWGHRNSLIMPRRDPGKDVGSLPMEHEEDHCGTAVTCLL